MNSEKRYADCGRFGINFLRSSYRDPIENNRNTLCTSQSQNCRLPIIRKDKMILLLDYDC